MPDPITPETIRRWRANYGLDQRSPADAMRWWAERSNGQAPAGAVAALGLCIGEIERLRQALQEIERSTRECRDHHRAHVRRVAVAALGQREAQEVAQQEMKT